MTTFDTFTKLKTIVKPGNVTDIEQMFDLVLEAQKNNEPEMKQMNIEVRQLATKAVKGNTVDAALKLEDIIKKTYLIGAKAGSFDDYLIFIEWSRQADKRFYLPRRHYLKRIVDAYQEIADGLLDFLSISLCKRAGKSQLSINFVNFLSGREPNKSTLMEGAGDALIRSFYQGCLEILQSPEYLHYDVFPDNKIVATNADIKTINLNKRSRFPTIMCRSIDSTQVGLSEATNLLYLDDVIEGREESKDRNRLDKKWEILSGDVLGRRVEGTPIVICGTRYSIYDPHARLMEKADELGWRWKAIEIPALDPITDESNYEHLREGKKVFTTEYFRNERKLLSEEQWMSEFQQEPFEAKGVMFPESRLNRFFKLPPDKDPDTIIAVIDSAERGSDSVMMPVAYVYGEDVFILDCVFDSSPPETTKPQCAKKLIEHKVSSCTVESNAAGEYFARDVEEIMRKNGGRTSIKTKRSISNKLTRIEMASDGIMRNFYFLDESLYERGSQYWNMMRELTSFTRTGKNAHDDSCDGLSLLEAELRNVGKNRVVTFRRSII